MASESTATAAMLAATGTNFSKSRPNALRTPLSATYPSSLHSPTVSTPGFLKPDIHTPLTPPSAYLEFLNKMSPSVGGPSPLPSATSSHFSFNARSPTVINATSAPRFARPPTNTQTLLPPVPLSARPLLNSNSSASSSGSSATDSTASSKSSSTAHLASSERATASEEEPSTAQQSEQDQAAQQNSANTSKPMSRTTSLSGPIRRPSLIIPPSPTTRSPSLMSPASGCALKTPRSANGTQKVTVRYSVTRTVTYTRTPLSAHPANGKNPFTLGLPPRSIAGALAEAKKAGSRTAAEKDAEEDSQEDDDYTSADESVTTDESSSKNEDGEDVDGETTPKMTIPLVGTAPPGKRRKIDTDEPQPDASA